MNEESYSEFLVSKNGYCECDGLSELFQQMKKAEQFRDKCNHFKMEAELDTPREDDFNYLMTYKASVLEFHKQVYVYFKMVANYIEANKLKLVVHDEALRKPVREVGKEEHVKLLEDGCIITVTCPDCGQQIDVLSAGQKRRGVIVTGYDSMDGRLLTGDFLRAGAIYIIASRPAMGKTSFAINIMNNNIEVKIPAVYITLGDTARAIENRLLSIRTGIPLWDLHKRNLTKEQTIQLTKVSEQFREKKFQILDYSKETNFESVITELEQFADSNFAGIVFLDYIELIDHEGYSKTDYDSKNTRFLKVLKEIAEKSRVVFFVLSQLSCDVESRKDQTPAISDLYGGAELATLAEKCFLLTRDERCPEDILMRRLQIFIVDSSDEYPIPLSLFMDRKTLRLSDVLD